MNRLAWTVCVLALILSITGCDISNRQPVKPTAFTGELPRQTRNVLLVFNEVIPGKPLDETIWDNVSGPIWDLQESKQIGYTQHYQPTTPKVIIVSSRILVPFGRTFSATLESAIEKSSTECHVAFDSREAGNFLQDHPVDLRVVVTLDSFSLWEKPLNHLNFSARGHCEVLDKSGTPLATCNFEKSVLKYKIANIWNTHNQVINEMNKLSNDFAGQLTADIFLNCRL